MKTGKNYHYTLSFESELRDKHEFERCEAQQGTMALPGQKARGETCAQARQDAKTLIYS